MKKVISVHNNKTLRLENVLVRQVIEVIGSDTDEEKQSEIDMSLEVLVSQMENQVKSKGATTVGPIIQYTGTDFGNEEIKIIMALMIQANRYIVNPDPGFKMESVIKVPNCMYARFEGKEEELQIAYKKIEVEAYENDISLKGNSYTVFVDGDDEGNIVADIFMEKENE